MNALAAVSTFTFERQMLHAASATMQKIPQRVDKQVMRTTTQWGSVSPSEESVESSESMVIFVVDELEVAPIASS